MVTYQLFIPFILYDCWHIQDLSQLQVEIQYRIHFVVIGLVLGSFCWFFMNDLMATCNVLVADWTKQIDLSESWEIESLLVFHELRMILFKGEVLRLRLVLSIEKVIEDIFLSLVDFPVKEDGAVWSWA